MADGWGEADILGNYPGITHEDILACLAYARDTLSSEKVYPSATRTSGSGRLRAGSRRQARAPNLESIH